MEELLKGIIEFRKNAYQSKKELFMGLKHRQVPHTLFICCSDSRVDPGLITASSPGELFTIRNIANMVPPFDKADEHISLSSAIEYAVQVLEVKDIVVCGHSNCGGCAAILKPPAFLERWLSISHPLKERVLKELETADGEKRDSLIEQANVLEQINNLLSYPYIDERVKTGTLSLSAWHYIIETGEIFIYDKTSEMFQLAN